MIQIAESTVYWGCLSIAATYFIEHLIRHRCAPTLTNIFILITSVAAAYYGGELVYNILSNEAIQLGDLKKSKLVIVLGGVAVIWIAVASFINVLESKPDD